MQLRMPFFIPEPERGGDAKTHSLCHVVLFAILVSCSLLPAFAQLPQPQFPARTITGQLKLGGMPAPTGVPVHLRIVFNGNEKDENGESAEAKTDSNGRFTFSRLENMGKDHGQNLFSISAIQPGFEGVVKVVDLTEETHGEVTLDLRPAQASNTTEPSNAAPSGPADGVSSPPSAKAQAQQAFRSGQELLFQKHDPNASILDFKKAVKLDPWNEQAYMLLGLAQMQLQHWEDAQYAFHEAAKIQPGNAQAFLGVGSALNEQGQYAEAQKALEHSLELKPDSAEGHYELARSLAAIGKWDDATPHVQRALELNPDYAGPHALMGDIYVRQQDAPSALAQFKDYLRLAPNGSLAPQVKNMVNELEAALGPQ
jgi:Flp pilus assembly protein TadD